MEPWSQPGFHQRETIIFWGWLWKIPSPQTSARLTAELQTAACFCSFGTRSGPYSKPIPAPQGSSTAASWEPACFQHPLSPSSTFMTPHKLYGGGGGGCSQACPARSFFLPLDPLFQAGSERPCSGSFPWPDGLREGPPAALVAAGSFCKSPG